MDKKELALWFFEFYDIFPHVQVNIVLLSTIHVSQMQANLLVPHPSQVKHLWHMTRNIAQYRFKNERKCN